MHRDAWCRDPSPEPFVITLNVPQALADIRAAGDSGGSLTGDVPYLSSLAAASYLLAISGNTGVIRILRYNQGQDYQVAAESLAQTTGGWKLKEEVRKTLETAPIGAADPGRPYRLKAKLAVNDATMPDGELANGTLLKNPNDNHNTPYEPADEPQDLPGLYSTPPTI